jgi:hypothetical protein
MAKAAGISLRSVQRIWYAHKLQPHRIRTFKRSRDPNFEAKLNNNIVGLYMGPPAHTVVLSLDEKSQIRALDRPGRACRSSQAAAGRMITSDMERPRLFAEVHPLPQCHRAPSADWKARPCHTRQLRHPQTSEGDAMVGQASAMDLPLHTNLWLVAQRC